MPHNPSSFIPFGCGQRPRYEIRGCTKSRGAADLPVHVARVSAIDHENRRVAGGRECAPDLENELRIGVALNVESQCSRQLGRRQKSIDTRCERESTQIYSSLVKVGRSAREIEVRDGDLSLSLKRDRIGCVYRSGWRHDPRRKANDRATWVDSQISGDDARAGIGHRRAAQNREALRRGEQNTCEQPAILQAKKRQTPGEAFRDRRLAGALGGYACGTRTFRTVQRISGITWCNSGLSVFDDGVHLAPYR